MRGSRITFVFFFQSECWIVCDIVWLIIFCSRFIYKYWLSNFKVICNDWRLPEVQFLQSPKSISLLQLPKINFSLGIRMSSRAYTESMKSDQNNVPPKYCITSPFYRPTYWNTILPNNKSLNNYRVQQCNRNYDFLQLSNLNLLFYLLYQRRWRI